jgi:hypothetical protein
LDSWGGTLSVGYETQGHILGSSPPCPWTSASMSATLPRGSQACGIIMRPGQADG